MIRYSLFALSLLTGFCAPAYASGLSATQSVEQVITTTNEDGEIVRAFVPAERLAPGDELRYALAYENASEAAADNVVLVMPVPEEVTLIEGSAMMGAAIVEYSADAGESFALREALTVTEANITRAAIADDITHVRWTFTQAVAPASTGTVTYRGRLN